MTIAFSEVWYALLLNPLRVDESGGKVLFSADPARTKRHFLAIYFRAMLIMTHKLRFLLFVPVLGLAVFVSEELFVLDRWIDTSKEMFLVGRRVEVGLGVGF